MEQINTKIKKWGNSFGIILPKKIVDSENLTKGLEINIKIQAKNKMTVKDLLNFAKKQNIKKPDKSTDKLMKEIDKELWQD